jgi:hypothetical protein
MNAVDIEEAVSELAAAPCDAGEFPFAFLAAFDKKGATLKRLRAGATNKSDIPGGVLKRDDIHIATCEVGRVAETLTALRASPRTASEKAKYILATDGVTLEAEDLTSDDAPVVCDYADFPNHFGFFLPLAGITTVKQIRESAFDIRATSRLNRLYLELLKDNPDWASAERRPDMNHFMARLIFCFFAEDTDIFGGERKFTTTVETMSARDSSNTHEVLGEIFRAMDTRPENRDDAGIPRWANTFPYVNGGLFAGASDAPVFSKIARSYFLHIGGLDWTKINPDIFGSMIQAVADDEERGALGMHYTSVPNILKVLNPLFLDDLQAKLEEAGDNARTLLNLRRRMARIRVFDPACGSGNFLVIAYKQMRAIEAQINERRGESDRRTEIPLTNFRGIELRDFPAEIARLALIIAEYQCDVLYRGQQEALADFLPLDAENWITCGNALRLDWLSVCPPTGTGGGKIFADDLFGAPLDQARIDFENEGGETYICGNPPYLGSQGQSDENKSELKAIFEGRTKSWKSLDYVAGWFMKAADYGNQTPASTAFVSTNSICQGKQVSILWPIVFRTGTEITFAYTSFKWANLASHNAGVIVAIVGISRDFKRAKYIYSQGKNGHTIASEVDNINAYLVRGSNVEVENRSRPVSNLQIMNFGNQPIDGGHFTISDSERDDILSVDVDFSRFVYRYIGSREFINGIQRLCLWIEPADEQKALKNQFIATKIANVAKFRSASDRPETVALASTPFQFAYRPHKECDVTIIVPSASSERREFLPCGIVPKDTIISNLAFAIYDTPIWNMALIASRLHVIWIGTVCGKLKTDFRYSNTLGWNTFPVPTLTEKNKADLTRCAEDILLAREAHYPATIADLYDPKTMPADLRAAHDRNDEVLERIYIGRRFKNDTERLEKLFELYSKMVASKARAS